MTIAAYRVRVAPRPVVLNETGEPVPDGVVIDIRFPGETVDTPAGPIDVIAGLGVAKILVDEQVVRGVPLC